MKKVLFLQLFQLLNRYVGRKGKNNDRCGGQSIGRGGKSPDLFGNDILRLAYSYMKSREDAEDIVQEVLIRLMQSAGVFEDESHEKRGF